MLIRRNLSLGDPELGSTLIVRHEQFADYRAAVDVISRARVEADALLLEAENLRQDYLDRALAQFWDQASSLLEALEACLLYTSPSPRDLSTSRMPSSA